jgi:proline dehydrogenase
MMIALHLRLYRRSDMKQSSTLSFDNTEVAFAYQSDKALKKARFIFSAMRLGWLVKAGSALAPWALKIGLPIKGLIRHTVFRQFCGGETLEEAAETAGKLAAFRVRVILDYGVEAAEGEANYDQAVGEFKKAISYAAGKSGIPFISLKVTGFARFALLEKIHAAGSLDEAEQAEWERVRDRIYAICSHAGEKGIGVLVDAEESWIQQPVDDLAGEMMARFNTRRAVVYNTFQLYRHDRLAFLQQSFVRAQEANFLLGAKLVRGAYMEKERKRAVEKGYPSPIQPDKAATDRAYDQAVAFCLERLESIVTFIGTHNEQSCLLGARLLEENGIPPRHPHVHFSQLYGMSDNITFNLADAGYHASKYVPYGPIKEVMPYLIRRAQENSSVSGQVVRDRLLIREEIKRRRL